jgi:signal transduction histidine kinase/ligand-binding sensor domain-containing protein/DNA-binding response OmpR family regulator
MLASACLATVTPSRASGQQAPAFVHEVWTVQDGLPVNSINGLLQSRDGYLWAATFDGLVRFDGVRFTVYHTGNTEELPSNRIVGLTEGSDGSLWLVTEQRHLVRYHDGTFTHFGPERGVPADVHKIHVAANGVVWVGAANGLGFIQDDRVVPVAEDVITSPIVAIASHEDELVVASAGRTVYRYDGDSASVILHRGDGLVGILTAVALDQTGTPWIGTDAAGYRLGPDGPELLFPRGAREFYLSDDGTMWAHGAGGVSRLEDGVLVRASRQPQSVSRSMFQTDEHGGVWYGAGTDVYRDGELVYTLGPWGPETPVPAAEARAVVIDHEGSVWIGTNANGLHRLKPSLFTVYSQPEGLPHQNLYPVLEDRSSGAMWFGTWGGGLSRMTGETVSTVPNTGAFVLSLMEDDAGMIWVGHYSSGVRVCDPKTLRCALPSPEFRFGTFWALYRDVTGTTWLGSNRGLFRSESEGWTVLDETDGAPGAPVRVFLETRDGALWMGTNGEGLARYSDGEFLRFRAADGAPSDLIRSLYQDPDGWLWIGTEGHGLARIDPVTWPTADDRGSAVTRILPRDGLFDQVIHQILEDDFGRMWMSTNRGIFWVRRDELNALADGRVELIHSTGYTERHGLRNREANGGFQPAGIKASDGRLWFPTQDGAVVVDPARLQANLVPPPVVVERLVVGDESYRPGAEAITLDAGQRDLQIDYTALSFVAPENVRFRYRLEGYNDDWVDAGSRRTAFYTNIPPGSYTFRVIASNEEGVWNEEGAGVALRVTPRFYETTTWYLSVAAALGLLTLAAFRWRALAHRQRERELTQLVEARTDQLRHHEAQLESQNAQLEKQATRMTELDQAKSRFFANVSHEFRTPLTLTIGPLEDVRGGLYGPLTEEPSRQLGMALRNARRLLRLVNQIMDVAKLDSGDMKLHAREQDLGNFVREIAAAFAAVAERQHIRLKVETPPAEISVWFDADALETVLTNLLSNAFKFTPENGVISVTLVSDQGTDTGNAVMRIADSGHGIPAGDLDHVFERFYQVDDSKTEWQPGTGIGLSLVKELVLMHGGDIQVESETGVGSIFTVTLPLGRGHLQDDQVVTEGAAGERPRTPRWTAAGELMPEVVVATPAIEPDSPSNGDAEDVPTILVVDDNADVREYIRGHLERRYRVVEAADGVEGLASAERLIPDLVISDVMMPEMDGYELCRSLRANPETDFLPVILLTAKADTEHKVAGLTEGADDYVVKPFEMDELEARVANLIASRRRLRERFGGEHLELHAKAAEVTSADTVYLDRVRSVIEQNLGDESFGVAQLAQAVGQDRSHLYRRIHTLLDETPSNLLRRLRLERASQLLAGQAGTVAEIAYAVGFNSVSYFCKCFREKHGVTPSGFRGSKREG